MACRFVNIPNSEVSLKKLSKKAFEEIRAWVYRNARNIELTLWKYEFENGCADDVVSALSCYQNADGGFAHALEPDCWNPESSPYTTLNAIGKLEKIGFTDTGHPIVRGILKYLESCAYSNENGWYFSIPSNNACPRAPWWTFDEDANEYEHIGVTAEIACFALQYAEKDSALYKKSRAIAAKLLSQINEPGNKGDMGLSGYCTLIDNIEKTGLSGEFDATRLRASVKKLADGAIVRDPAQWGTYTVRPSQFIHSPDSPYYPGNEDIVEKELDYLIDTRPDDGVWGITWLWHGNYALYPKEFAISENWWKADADIGATGKLIFLRNFGRLE